MDSYGVPSRVRSDFGVENVHIAQFMITMREPGRGSINTGSSTHNLRVERMWRDVHRVVSIKTCFNQLVVWSHSMTYTCLLYIMCTCRVSTELWMNLFNSTIITGFALNTF